MMMKRRHDEKPLASELETQHLQNHGDGFDYKNAPHYDQEQLLFTTYRDDAEHAPDGKRSGVAHKHLGRIAVEPKKAQPRADKRRADNGQFACERIERDLQVFGDTEIAGRVAEQGIRKRHRDCASASQTIQPISEIHRVRRADDDQHKKHEGEPAHVRNHRSFYERHVERTCLDFYQRIGEKQASDDRRQNNLEKQFDPTVNAFGFLLRDFQIIIGEPEAAEVNHAEKGEPDELVIETSPKNARNNHGANHQHAAHSRCSLLDAL